MLTERAIRDAKPGSKARILWDKKITGFGLKIQPGGTRSFVLDYRVNGTQRRVSMGRAGEVSLKDARERAGRELTKIRAGEGDPLRRREDAAAAPTIADVVERFFREYVPGRIERGRMAERTAADYRQQCNRYVLPALGKLKVADVARGDIERMLKPLKPVQRNRVASLASRLFNLAEHWEYRPQHTNPVRGVERAREQPRDRVLAPSEMRALGAALAGMSDASLYAVGAIRMAALTGWRVGEVLALKWENVDFETGLATLPSTKTGRQTRALGSASLELLASMPRVSDNAHVFAGGVAGTAITYKTVRAVFARAAGAADLTDIRLHDLRRTVATNAAAAGVAIHTLRDLLGHSTLAMSNRYVRRTGGALVEAVEQSSAGMAAMMSDGEGAKVVPLRRSNKDA